MRTFLIACFVLAAVSGFGHSGETTNQVWFCDGVYALDIADGWSYEEESDGITLKNAEYPNSFMLITTPNPITGKSNQELIETVLKAMGEGMELSYEITGSEEATFSGHPSHQALMVAPDKEDPKLFFVGEVVDFGGYQVVLFGMATEEELHAGFGDASDKLMKSYAFNKDKADEHKDKLESVGATLNESF